MRESEIYYAQLVEAESTRSVMQGIRQVIERHGIFCALYSDRASHFFLTPKAGEAVDRQALTPGRASVKRIGDSIDTGLFTASTWTQRTLIWDLAGQTTAGTQNPPHWWFRTSKPFFADRVYRRVQSKIHGWIGVGRHGFCAVAANWLWPHLFNSIGARCR